MQVSVGEENEGFNWLYDINVLMIFSCLSPFFYIIYGTIKKLFKKLICLFWYLSIDTETWTVTDFAVVLEQNLEENHLRWQLWEIITFKQSL